ncbi:MAG: Na+/H+ antiporter NhaC family protein [Halanaerobiales bacterium]
MDHYGILSLVPPLLAILLAWWSKEVLLSLFVGVFSGALILNGYNPIVGFVRTLDNYILTSLADEWNAGILIFTITMGGMVGIISKAGGAKSIGEYIAKKAKTVKTTQFSVWLLGIGIFFDDYANTLIVGNTMRPITDRQRISREKLAYITDTTAAAMASITPISTWIAYEVGMIKDAFDAIEMEASAYTAFVQTIPYRFYSLFALILVPIIIFTRNDFGPMFDAETRARKTGKVLRDGATPMASKELTDMDGPEGKNMSWKQAFLPIIVTVAVTIFGLWYNGGGPTADRVIDAFGNADSSVVLIWAAFSGSITAALLAWGGRVLPISDVVEGWVDGSKSMIIACFILILAWSIGAITEELGTAEFVVGIAEGNITPFIIPSVVFVIGSFIAFTTGSSWGTVAILMPLAVPLANSLGAPLLPAIAAVLTGGVWGDHCSPISDTTIMSSTAAGSDHIDHVKTQIPYAFVGAAAAIIFGFIPAGFGVSPYISLTLGIIAMYLFIKYMGRTVEEHMEDIDMKDLNMT